MARRPSLLVAVFLTLIVGITTHHTNDDDDEEEASSAVACNVARLKCAYRAGCGMALHHYLMFCADVNDGRTQLCSEQCKKALIALTSTDEGQALTRCHCGDDAYCARAKRRIEVCRPAVQRANNNGTVVGCSVAQLICASDASCSMALEYYHRLCRSLVQGRKCTLRCKNSLAILNRQPKAAKLRNCTCDPTDADHDVCLAVKTNVDRLCLRKRAPAPSTQPPLAARALATGIAWSTWLLVLLLVHLFT